MARVLICDDSGFARKQLARALPEGLATDVQFAANGREALAILEAEDIDLMFLDLTMPEMDGYQTLKAMSANDIEVPTIVVSGDIQPEARTRVLSLGALEFIKKPIDKAGMAEVLADLGWLSEAKVDSGPSEVVESLPEVKRELSLNEILQEVANVAMGRAADLLARLLNVFVKLPVPKVVEVEYGDLLMMLADANREENISAVCQGFIGYGIAGEALLLYTDSSLADMAKIMRYTEEGPVDNEVELLIDTANVLIGACLAGIAQQLDIQFSQGHPRLLGKHVQVTELLKKKPDWRKTLAIEIHYEIEGHNVACDLILLFTEDSLPQLQTRASYLSEAS